MVRPAHRRSTKYRTGIDADLTARKLRALKPVMVDLETPYLAQITEVERKVKRICETAAVPSYEIAQYINYARQLFSKSTRFESLTLTNEAQYLTDHWISRGLSCPILIDVAELFGIVVTCEAEPSECSGLICSLHAPISESGAALHWIRSLAMANINDAPYVVYNDCIELHYFPLTRRCRFDRIGLFVGVASANPLARAYALLYGDTGNLYPSALLAQGGPYDVSAVGQKETVIDVTLDRGAYWIGYFTNVDDWTTFGNEGNALYGLLPIGHDLVVPQSCAWYFDQAWPNIPNPFPLNATPWRVYFSIGLRLAEVL